MHATGKGGYRVCGFCYSGDAGPTRDVGIVVTVPERIGSRIHGYGFGVSSVQSVRHR